MTFQSGLTVIEVLFEEEEEDEDPKPLRMEHFYFPLGTWLIGLFLSVFCLLAEIIFHCLTTKTDVPPAVLEEPGVAQSNTKLNDGRNSDTKDFEDTEV